MVAVSLLPHFNPLELREWMLIEGKEKNLQRI